MKTAQKWMVATGAGLVLVALVILLGGGLNARPEKDSTTAAGVGTQAPQASHPLPPARQLSWQGSPPATGLEQPLPPSASNPLDNLTPPVFRANPTGDLVMDPQTRTDVERLHALNERDDALAKLEALSRNLPAQARRELRELYQQHVQYTQAVTRSFPPGVEVDSVDKVLQQFEGLHELRVQYFGADRAEKLFGEEEQATREMLALMQAQKSANLSLGEQAAQAQATWSARRAAQP